MNTLNLRRRFLGRSAGLATAAATSSLLPLSALAQAARVGRGAPLTSPLPKRGEYRIRNAHVVTMDGADIPGGDVHVKDGVIAAVGRDLPATPGAEIIDARGMIVMPGIVETHWHLWNTLLRSMSGETSATGYFPAAETLGKLFTPRDMYLGVLLSAAEAINSGVTTVHDWCHNTLSPAHVDQDIAALNDAGIRARFSYGYPQGHPRDQAINLDDLVRVKRDHFAGAANPLLTMGYAARGIRYPGAYPREWEFARKLGLPISAHANITKKFGNEEEIERLHKDGFLGPDVQIIHALTAPPAAIEAMASSRCSVSISPYSEMRIGFGFPQVGALVSAGIVLTLSVDTVTLSGNADMFGVMKATLNIENARTEDEFRLKPRRVLQMATIDGARGLGIDRQVGSLQVGKRADLILLRRNDINMTSLTDASHLVVEAAQPANVDSVMVDGRFLKRRGKLTSISTDRLAIEASAALARLKQQANWS
jgi:cytosine/adenosine deaminase-related metal-dependent hydrolase